MACVTKLHMIILGTAGGGGRGEMDLKGEGELAAVLRFHSGAQEVLWLSATACDVFKSVFRVRQIGEII